VNTDNDSVSVINVQNDANQKVAEIPVGDEPNNLAITPNGQTVYVANTISGTVSVINTASRQVVGTISVGAEPYGIALTPNGTKLYVTNARSDDISVISTAPTPVLRTIRLQAPVPCPGCPPVPPARCSSRAASPSPATAMELTLTRRSMSPSSTGWTVQERSSAPMITKKDASWSSPPPPTLSSGQSSSRPWPTPVSSRKARRSLVG